MSSASAHTALTTPSRQKSRLSNRRCLTQLAKLLSKKFPQREKRSKMSFEKCSTRLCQIGRRNVLHVAPSRCVERGYLNSIRRSLLLAEENGDTLESATSLEAIGDLKGNLGGS